MNPNSIQPNQLPNIPVPVSAGPARPPDYNPNQAVAGPTPFIQPANLGGAAATQFAPSFQAGVQGYNPQNAQAYGPQIAQPGQAGPQGVSGPAAPKSNPNSTQNSLQIAEIRDGIVIMQDGSFRSVIMVKSINFDLMSPQEREAVEYSYQGFLNSLYFPIQIFTRSQKVDLRPYIEKLDKIRSEHDNMLLALLMEDYIGFMSDLATQTSIMDKKFYVVVPFIPVIDGQKAVEASKNFVTNFLGSFSKKEVHVTINEADLEAAKTELRNRVQATLGGLLQCGVQGLPLDTQELIELYYDAYNPDTATRQKLKNFNDLSAPVITKGAGFAPQPELEKELPA
ncbi:MAG: hypothetical protein JWO47_985 [Candidatus Saccharibacteria bacterium]|nr:hypothetical protein [Candidatus Saccharibacteria bacterium]